MRSPTNPQRGSVTFTISWTRRKTKQKSAQKDQGVFMKNRSHHPGSSTHVVIAAFVVLVFGLYVDRKLGQEGALRGQRTRQWERNDQKANLIRTSLFSHTETTKSGFFFYSLSPYLFIGVAQRSWPNISALPHFLFYFMSSCQKSVQL